MFRVLKSIFRLIYKYRYVYLAALLLIVIASILTNIRPLIIREIVNEIENEIYTDGYKLFIILIFITFIQIIIRSIAIYVSDIVLLKATKDLRVKVFEHLHKLDFAYHSDKSSGSLISLFKRGEGAFLSFYDHINLWALETILDFVFMTFIFFSLYPKLVIVSVLTFVINAVFMVFTVRLNVKKRKEVNNWEDKITGITVDNMVAFDTVKHFANERYEQSRLEKIIEKWRQSVMLYSQTFRVIDLSNGGIVTLGMLTVIGVALFDLVNGNINTGDFVLALSFATLFFPKMIHLVFNFREVAKHYVDLKRYLSVLEEPVRIKETPKPIAIRKWKELERENKYDIKMQDVDFSFDGKVDVLSDINIEIKSGESVALVGKSGAGKTTITKLLMRFYDPQKGQIKIGGIDIKDLPKENFRKKIGFVPQEAILFNDTIGYNLAYGREEFTMNELIGAAKIANLHDFIKSLPEGFQTIVGERGIKLSGGQKQRLAIARVVMENAPIIIFDEATSNLDSESEKMIQEAFWNIAKTKTTIIIAHRLSTVRKSDRIIVMDSGKIVEIGTHKQLTNKQSGIYKHLWELQTSGELSE
ncbi:ATP-binding cassette domain-containing protein [Candidatus Dojkabacteria bacterium]|nr:ATP-binding cassette domain-containing protein [Candidatus Dojkabacteria bacterium]